MRTAARECVLKYLYAERINDECGGQLFAVNLVSKYSTEKSMGFVNGILAEFGRRRGLNS